MVLKMMGMIARLSIKMMKQIENKNTVYDIVPAI